MKTKITLLLMALMPCVLVAHPLPIAHNHDGILNGWEGIMMMAVAILIAALIARKFLKPSHD